MHIGFTGSRQGMTDAQKSVVATYLEANRLKAIEGGSCLIVHHGDCVGSDAQFHDIAKNVGALVIIHPPKNGGLRAYKAAAILKEPKEYLERNRDIAADSQMLIATPQQRTEQLRSGTWATIRYAKALGKAVRLVFPDGDYVDYEPKPEGLTYEFS